LQEKGLFIPLTFRGINIRENSCACPDQCTGTVTAYLKNTACGKEKLLQVSKQKSMKNIKD